MAAAFIIVIHIHVGLSKCAFLNKNYYYYYLMLLIILFNKLITAVCSQLGSSFKLNVSDGLILNFEIFRDFRKKYRCIDLKKEIFVNSRMLAS